MARILLVDRVPFMSDITKFALSLGGHEVIAVARDGLQALEIYATEFPDLVITELILQKYNGIQVLEKLMLMDSEVKVIICTAVQKDSMVDRAMACGASAYILKPFQMQSFLSEVSRVLGEEKPELSSLMSGQSSRSELTLLQEKIMTRQASPEEIALFLKKYRK